MKSQDYAELIVHELRAPKLHENEDTVWITQLLKNDGEKVSKGEILFILETIKATIEVEAEADGYLFYIRQPDEEMRIGELIAVIAKDKSFDPEPLKIIKDKDEPRATKRAVQLAKEKSINLAEIKKDGVIREKDIKNYLQAGGFTKEPEIEEQGEESMITKPKIVLIGAGGQSCDVIELIDHLGSFEIAGFLDIGYPDRKEYLGYPILGDETMCPDLKGMGIDNVVICYGWFRDINQREKRTKECADLGLCFPTLIHQDAYIYRTSQIGEGCIVFPNSTIGANVVLETGVVVNHNAVVSHDCRIGAYSGISPGAMVASNVKTGPRCIIGMNASIFYGVELPPDKIVFNNTAVQK